MKRPPRLLKLRDKGPACKFGDCPAGLFMFEGRIGVKMKTGFGYIEPGELFIGHECANPEPVDQVAVQPVDHVWEACNAE